ncbi:ABC transporter ATP-binding protein [Ornithinibacillus gellani]|uniref:ABC transporter ATP-binding protein n=1 Tax=Ornithinibacillus gellani TaxID=2293253 RepID=UPI000F491B73|nr:ABC transporter ATP-binding protein [Ornithinibacillus gellani]TQS74858.1 ABC transporter ATP-binding protein [Ornithinibacillus gellani]
MIEIKNVSQSYQKQQVLHNVNLVIERNERCALVGRNGAGKSTLIHTMLGLLPLKQGSVMLGGHCNKKQTWKKHVSYLPEKFHLYQHLTGEENMRFFASLESKQVNQKRMEEKLQVVSLWNARHMQIHQYSKGMLQRLGLAIMLYYDSEIIILDEPTSGLDPIGREEILQIIQSLTDKTILMASHHVDEIKKVCTHVAYLEDGAITKHTIEDFAKKYLQEA